MTSNANVAAAAAVEEELAGGDDSADEEDDEEEEKDQTGDQSRPKYTPDKYFRDTLTAFNKVGVEDSFKKMTDVVIPANGGVNPYIAAIRSGGNGSTFTEDPFHHPDLAVVDPPGFFGVGMPCPRYGWAHAHHCHRRYKRPALMRPRCVRFPGNKRLYVTSCQWVCDECTREKVAAKEAFEKEKDEEEKKKLKTVWKATKSTFMAYNEKVFDAYLSNPETAFIPLNIYPYVHAEVVSQWRERVAINNPLTNR